MVELSVALGKLFIGSLCFLGSFAWLVMLRTHQRREAMLNTWVLQELNVPELRGLFVLRIKSKPLLREVVAVDLWNCSRDQIWDVMQRLSVQLPSHIRVQVNGIGDCRTRSTWTLTAKRNPCRIACCPQ